MKRYSIKNETTHVHLTEWGEKEFPVIICLHGLGSTSLSFIEIAEELKDHYHIIAIDAPGHGSTPPFKHAEEYEMPQMACWLDNIIDELQIHDFYLLSHSWGSFLALYYLYYYGERVIGSILIDGGYQTKRLGNQSMEEEAAFYEQDFEEYVDSWKKFLDEAAYGSVTRRSKLLDLAAKDLAIEKNGNFYWHARGKTAGYIIQAMHKHETIDLYDALPSTIILLRATLPEHLQEKRQLTSTIFKEKTGCSVKLIPETTHMLHWDSPEIVINEVKSNWGSR
ncbi:alpha/beta hydrolase [Guptibacillus spartinae]|uniref:alpha/beta hydrolase n=1 Tax=Guptibacillus spartinae TaxID=3025679 RepID=UPI00235FF5CF|nr:alpha/beta fold hydrolase [Pseudalkalibacillus spartinae]